MNTGTNNSSRKWRGGNLVLTFTTHVYTVLPFSRRGAHDAFTFPCAVHVVLFCTGRTATVRVSLPVSHAVSIKDGMRVWGDGWVSRGLRCKHEDLSLELKKPCETLGTATRACNPSAGEVG